MCRIVHDPGATSDHRTYGRQEKQGECKTDGSIGLWCKQQGQHHNRPNDEQGSPPASAEDQESQHNDPTGDERSQRSLEVNAHQQRGQRCQDRERQPEQAPSLAQKLNSNGDPGGCPTEIRDDREHRECIWRPSARALSPSSMRFSNVKTRGSANIVIIGLAGPDGPRTNRRELPSSIGSMT